MGVSGWRCCEAMKEVHVSGRSQSVRAVYYLDLIEMSQCTEHCTLSL